MLNSMAETVITTEPKELTDVTGISKATIKRIEEYGIEKQLNRKDLGRITSRNLINHTILQQFDIMTSYKHIHNTNIPGILSLDVQSNDTDNILTGGNDKRAVVFNKAINKKIIVLEGHKQKVTKVIYHPLKDIVITGSKDATIRVWHISNKIPLIQIIKAHEDSVTCMALHPSGDYILSTSADHHWSFSDMNTGELISRVSLGSFKNSFTASHIHPDGLIFGTGTSDSKIIMWDIKNQKVLGTLKGHSGLINAISFAGNGNYLATSANDFGIHLWDLRKFQVFETLYLHKEYKIMDLCFDNSGTYLGVAGSDIRLYHGRMNWQQLKVFNDQKSMVTGIRFGKDSQFIVTSSIDGTLNLYGI